MQSLWINFSQALGLSMCMHSNQKVRPKGICSDTLANEGMELDEDQEGIPEEIGKEGRAIPGKKMIYEPTKAEYVVFIIHSALGAQAVCKARVFLGLTNVIRRQRVTERENSQQ